MGRQKTPLTEDDLRQSIHADFERAAATLYYIEARDGSGLQLTHLWPDQLELTRTLESQRAAGQPMRGLVVKTRRAGTSTAAAEWTFHHSYWRSRQKALLVAHHDSTTSVLYDLYRTLYTELPPELQLPLQKLNRKEIATVPPHASSIVAQTAGYLDIGRGPTIHHAHLSEVDFWPDPEVALDGILNSVHLGADTTIIVESTANGADGWLHHFWRETKRGKTMFAPIFMAWFRVPEHRVKPWSDFELTAEEQTWQAQYGLTRDQLAWYRLKMNEAIAKEPWGGERKMRQEHPFTDEEAFQSSGYCVFPDIVLKRLKAGCRAPTVVRRLEHLPQPGAIREVPADYDPRLPQLTVWTPPEEGRFYSLGVDISDGVGQTESVVSVCAYPGYEQVAEWGSSRSSVEETTYVARYLAEKYGGHNCLLIPEVNRNGNLILYLLYQLTGNYGIFRWRYLDRPGMEMNDNPKLGWETNENTKKALVQVANMVFLRGQGEIRSEVLHEQMQRCLDVLPGKRWRAAGGKSDRVIAWLVAMIGAYLDFEGGTVNAMVSDRRRHVASEEIPGWREPSRYDTGVEEVYGGRVVPVGSAFRREDQDER